MASCRDTVITLLITLGIVAMIAASHKPVKYQTYQKTYHGMAPRGIGKLSHGLDVRSGYDKSSSFGHYSDLDWANECEGKFMCGMEGYGYYRHAKCIDMSMVCDGLRNCQNGRDEEHCPPNCHKIGKMQCSDEKTCGYKCDGKRDCPAGDDESDCPFICGSGMYRCKGSRDWCISGDKFCNGVNDCPDYEDEYNCPSTCKPGEYKCLDGKCIDKSKFCDGRPNDCSENEDESSCSTSCTNCPSTCRGNQFKCMDGSCIDGHKVCDRIDDCSPNIDETSCPPPCPTCSEGCSAGQYKCRDGTCISRNKVCDGVDDDCSDNDDESICSTCPTCPPPCQSCPPSCPANYCKCTSGECIEFSEVCDGNDDCSQDGEDELSCRDTCEKGQYWCKDSTDANPICIDAEDACETSVPNCPEANENGDLCK